MDLSSLEGPPICDPRFTPQARYHQPDTYIPSIRVDDTYNPRYPSGHYYRNTDYRDVSSSTGPRLNPTSNTGTGTSGSVESRPRARSNPPPLQRQPESSTTSRPSTPNRLIWLDGEKTWLLIEARGLEQMQPPRLERQHSRPQSLPRPPQPQPLQRSRPQRQRQRQHQHQCQCLYQGQGADQPPSYGDHQHDRVIAVQPMGSRGRDEEEDDDDDDDDEYEDEEPRPELARSKWGAVARRVNRMV